MARGTRNSPPATLVALILTVFLWIITTSVAVVLYIQSESYKNDALTAIKELNKYVVKEEKADPEIRAITAAGGKRTVVKQLQENIATLRLRIGGDGPIEGLNAKIDQTLKLAGLENTSLIAGVEQLAQQIKAQKSALAKVEEQLRTAEGEMKTASGNFSKEIKGIQSSLDEAKAQAEKVQGDLSQARKDREADAAKLQKQLTEAQNKHEGELREKVVQTAQLKDEMDRRNSRIRELTNQIGQARNSGPIDAVKGADGHILAAADGRESFFIDLGRKDHLNLGLTFAIYDPKTGMGKDATAKAAVEVTQLGETESVVRVLNVTKGQAVLEGDLIGNPVFNRDRSRKYHYVVYGEFDLDGDGVATLAEREKVSRLIQSWGGVIDETLTTQTDYLVLGTQPASAVNKYEAQTEQGKDLEKTRLAEQARYNQFISQAKDYSIPVLNANRFLNMIGYYNVTAVR